MKKLKVISTVLLSVMLMFTISTAVFADNEINEINEINENNEVNEDIWSDINETEGENSTNETVNESVFENIEVENEVEESNNEYNNLYNNVNSTTENPENLADTGIEDSGTIALIVMLSGVVAIYSAKKFNDYKNV